MNRGNAIGLVVESVSVTAQWCSHKGTDWGVGSNNDGDWR